LRAEAKHRIGVVAECLLAAQGYRFTDTDDDDDDDGTIARAYAGACIQAEAIAELKALRKDIVSLIRALIPR
jgi:hypothetical protein